MRGSLPGRYNTPEGWLTQSVTATDLTSALPTSSNPRRLTSASIIAFFLKSHGTKDITGPSHACDPLSF